MIYFPYVDLFILLHHYIPRVNGIWSFCTLGLMMAIAESVDSWVSEISQIGLCGSCYEGMWVIIKWEMLMYVYEMKYSLLYCCRWYTSIGEIWRRGVEERYVHAACAAILTGKHYSLLFGSLNRSVFVLIILWLGIWIYWTDIGVCTQDSIKEEVAEVKLPKKGKYRQRAHSNPLVDVHFDVPVSPDDVKWW